jgi:hypothetical protein
MRADATGGGDVVGEEVGTSASRCPVKGALVEVVSPEVDGSSATRGATTRGSSAYEPPGTSSGSRGPVIGGPGEVVISAA